MVPTDHATKTGRDRFIVSACIISITRGRKAVLKTPAEAARQKNRVGGA
jgi:hypothetical protein